MEDPARGQANRRRLAWPLVLAVALTLAIVAAGCGGEEKAAPPPAAEPAEPAPPVEEPAPAEPAPPAPAQPAECSVEGVDDGVINVFAAADTPSATIGTNLSPGAFTRMSGIWIDKANAEGGILGCQVDFVVDDDTFDIPTCVRQYKDALASGKYDFFIGPTNSGCMASLPPLTYGAGKWLFSGIAADHQPFYDPLFPKAPYVAHSSVSTFLEGRAAAVFAQKQGWKRVALMVPNYAYGQDVGKAFKDYYPQLVPDGEVVNEQFPEFDEDNFTPFINAMVGANPDGILTAFFSSFILPFMTQWQDSGNDASIEVIAGLGVLDTFLGIKSEGDIPQNFYAYDRGNWRLLEGNPLAKEYIDLWVAQYGDEFPIPDSFTFQLLSTWQMAKALIETTQSVDPVKWKATIEAGDFSFDGPYNPGPTYVNPISHMADTCASVGAVVWDETIPIPAVYDPNSFVLGCMHDVVLADEAKKLTTNPDVTDEAIAKYYELAGGGG